MSPLLKKCAAGYAACAFAAAITLAADENPTRRDMAKTFLMASGCVAVSLIKARSALAMLKRAANKPLEP
jgi:hypothetical protein